MPLSAFFKNPPMSLMLEGSLDKAFIKEVNKAFGKTLIVKNPDGEKILLITQADCDISYIAEITQEKMEEVMKNQEVEKARAVTMSGAKFDPTGAFPGRKRFTGKG